MALFVRRRVLHAERRTLLASLALMVRSGLHVPTSLAWFTRHWLSCDPFLARLIGSRAHTNVCRSRIRGHWSFAGVLVYRVALSLAGSIISSKTVL